MSDKPTADNETRDSEWPTLESYLRMAKAAGIIDFTIRCRIQNELATFYIHPAGRDGETADFAVVGNRVFHDPNVMKG